MFEFYLITYSIHILYYCSLEVERWPKGQRHRFESGHLNSKHRLKGEKHYGKENN